MTIANDPTKDYETETKTVFHANGRSTVTYCDEACRRIYENYATYVTEVFALPRTHPKKQYYLFWCLKYQDRFYKHLDDRHALGTLKTLARLQEKQDKVLEMARTDQLDALTPAEDDEKEKEMAALEMQMDEVCDRLWDMFREEHGKLWRRFEERPGIESHGLMCLGFIRRLLMSSVGQVVG